MNLNCVVDMWKRNKSMFLFSVSSNPDPGSKHGGKMGFLEFAEGQKRALVSMISCQGEVAMMA